MKSMTNTFGYAKLIKLIRRLTITDDAFESTLANALVHSNHVYIIFNPLSRDTYHIIEDKEEVKHYMNRLGRTLYLCLCVNSSDLAKMTIEVINTL